MSDYQIESREWWVLRWLELLDSYRFKKRLERARIYAREGNVLSIEFQESKVLAQVQGSEATPYQVSLSLDPFTDEDWDYAIATMSQKAVFSARLLAGEMPNDIEGVFTSSGLSLFPFTLSDIHSRCSCPDKANPCKHIGAVYYQLADRFSEDPFVIFQLRGRTKAQILDRLRQLRNQKQDSEKKINSNDVMTQKENSLQSSAKKNSASEKRTRSIEKFWQYNEPLDPSLVVITPNSENKTVLDLLGSIPLSVNDAQALRQYLMQVYQIASQQATILALKRNE